MNRNELTPLPFIEDPDVAGFWQAARERRLTVAVCASCEAVIHLPMAACPDCSGSDVEWRSATGLGTVHTYTRVEHQVHPGFPTPYTVVVVELDDYPTVHLIGAMDDKPNIGDQVRVRFDDVTDEITLPQWELAR
jgi:uncharacterized protein